MRLLMEVKRLAEDMKQDCHLLGRKTDPPTEL